jgi:hypothetical protein
MNAIGALSKLRTRRLLRIPEDEVRKSVEDGQDVLFMMAGVRPRCGILKVENGRLVFPTWQEGAERLRRTP